MMVSFDFDGTLSHKEVQEFAEIIINKGFEVWIVTARFDYDTYPVFDVAESLKIPKERIVFMNMYLKAEYFEKNSNFVWHLDNDVIELEFINRDTKVIGINVKNDNYKEECLKLLKNV